MSRGREARVKACQALQHTRYDLESRVDLDARRGKVIFLKHEKYDEKPERNTTIPCYGYRPRHRRPHEAVIKCGENKDCNKCYRRNELYDPLALLLLGIRTRIRP